MCNVIRKIGKSAGVIVPRSLLREFGAGIGDNVRLKVEAGKIVITRLAVSPRQGWAEDARRLVVAEDALSDWTGFADHDDARFAW